MKVYLAVCLTFSFGLAAAQAQLGSGAPAELEESLRERVSGFYTHFQRAEFRKAEDYLDEKSKDVFYGVRKNRITGFEINSIDWAEDFRSAKVIVACKTILPSLGSAPLSMPLTSQWNYVDGEWLMHLAVREISDENPTFQTPAGPMSFDRSGKTQGGGLPGPMSGPSIADLANMYKISTDTLRFPKDSAGPVTRTLTVKNLSKGSMSIRRNLLDVNEVEINIDKEQFGPGEEAQISFTYAPGEAAADGRREVDFMVMPLSQKFVVTLEF